MRRRRRLTVDTFPFLAVLLGAMGSLILVLLIFDYRAKKAAQARVTTEIVQRDKAARQAIEARRAELLAVEEARRREWEEKSEALRRDVEAKKQAVTGAIQQTALALEKTARQTEAERQAIAQAHQTTAQEQARIEAIRQAKAAGLGKVQESKTATQQAQKALEVMGKDLVRLEQTVRDLKESRKDAPNTYSVVPYKGKQGSDRRPLYIECTGKGVIFHPDRASRPVPFTPEEVRADLQKRIERQRPTLPEEQQKLPPYLLLLVRPDGIETYYDLQSSLKGESLVFGYEFIEKDWELEFPDDPATASTGSPLVRGPSATGSGTGSGSGSATGGGLPGAILGRPGFTGTPPRGVATGGGVPPAPTGERPTGPTPIEGIPPRSLPLPELGTTPPVASRLPQPQGEDGEPPTPGVAPLPGPKPEMPRRPARITPPREWLIHVECRADSAVLHPRNVNLPLHLLEGAAATSPLRTLVTEVLERQPEPVPGKAPRKLRVRFVVLPNGGERSFHAAYPALVGLPIDMDVIRLRPEDNVRAALLGP